MTIKLTPYFKTNGNAREVIRFYENVLDAEVLNIQTYGDLPIAFPDELKDFVAQAHVKIGDILVMFSDSPGLSVQIGDNVTMCITTDHVEKTNQIFIALQQDGHVVAPLEVTPFSPAFGTVTDKYGVTFTIMTKNSNPTVVS